MSYKEEDCLMYYRYNKRGNDVTPEKVFVAPNLVLGLLLKNLDIKLEDLMLE